MFKQRWFVILVVLLLSITLFSSTMYGESNNAKRGNAANRELFYY